MGVPLDASPDENFSFIFFFLTSSLHLVNGLPLGHFTSFTSQSVILFVLLSSSLQCRYSYVLVSAISRICIYYVFYVCLFF